MFSPQKGADSQCVQTLDNGLRHLAQKVQQELGIDIAYLPGAGAAGGMGGGCVAFFNGKLQMGIEVVLDTGRILTANAERRQQFVDTISTWEEFVKMDVSELQ